MKTNKQIISNFTNGEESKNKNLFAEKDNFGRLVLYSYGYHFPMALKLDDGLFIVNESKYSQTTSSHQGILKRLIGDGIPKTTDELKRLIGIEFRTQAELTEKQL